MLMAFVVSHPFRKKKRKGWSTEHFCLEHSPRGPVPPSFRPFLAKGSDISRDDGRTWTALSLPFLVGPNGRIGRLNAGALPKP
jgi:hypothetical protein